MVMGNARESLSREKNSDSRSPEARRSSFRLSFLPSEDELVSVSSRATTTTGTGVALFAVLGLNTRTLSSSNSLGALVEAACSASFHAAGDVAGACSTVSEGAIDRAARPCVMESIFDMDWVEKGWNGYCRKGDRFEEEGKDI